MTNLPMERTLIETDVSRFRLVDTGPTIYAEMIPYNEHGLVGLCDPLCLGGSRGSGFHIATDSMTKGEVIRIGLVMAPPGDLSDPEAFASYTRSASALLAGSVVVETIPFPMQHPVTALDWHIFTTGSLVRLDTPEALRNEWRRTPGMAEVPETRPIFTPGVLHPAGSYKVDLSVPTWPAAQGYVNGKHYVWPVLLIVTSRLKTRLGGWPEYQDTEDGE